MKTRTTTVGGSRDCSRTRNVSAPATCAARGRKWFTSRCMEGAFAVPSIVRTAAPGQARRQARR